VAINFRDKASWGVRALSKLGCRSTVRERERERDRDRGREMHMVVQLIRLPCRHVVPCRAHTWTRTRAFVPERQNVLPKAPKGHFSSCKQKFAQVFCEDRK
jgi:hypothetical protein